MKTSIVNQQLQQYYFFLVVKPVTTIDGHGIHKCGQQVIIFVVDVLLVIPISLNF